ncbi:hypothetical protein AWH56_008870 [Anaerobacillus isosaccharinicus]|uniref:Uncharacterized protein n=1 Tax=Anaerobacillus isosaccharinicus TaxID=1532552 RepID=A0A7S7LAV3_9BACI|nr:hypothetical protein [Anaerobacillus isosaccharinicus]MBA5588916.1 hypothetical protein [Anaerobacillus isosaccharinicus]QOY37673.1 hypothetical protein AWH56_008870 [Anaerobacillus isosaccharinicus]
MGSKFYEHDVPELTKEMKLLNRNLDRIATALEKQSEQEESENAKNFK